MRLARLIRTAGVGVTIIGAPACGNYCFVRGTRIWIPGGRRRIEELHPGDEVWSWSFAERAPVIRRVVHSLQAVASSTLRIAAGEIVLEGVTGEHPSTMQRRKRGSPPRR